MNRLNTREDKYHFHKTFGVLALLNFVYRFFNLFVYGSFLINSTVDYILLGCHAILSLSSLIFHISSTRNQKAPMIYPEFRLHNIAFAMRSIVCCCIERFVNISEDRKLILKMATCITTMVLADVATRLYPTHASTMRGMPFKDVSEQEQRRMKLMQSTAQVDATLTMLFNIDTAFSPLMAIQVASLLMTLVRKNLIKGNTFHIIYNFTLWINVFTVFNTMTIFQILAFQLASKIFCHLRFEWSINKYVGWFIAFIIYYLSRDYNSYFDYLEDIPYLRTLFFVKYFIGEILPNIIVFLPHTFGTKLEDRLLEFIMCHGFRKSA